MTEASMLWGVFDPISAWWRRVKRWCYITRRIFEADL